MSLTKDDWRAIYSLRNVVARRPDKAQPLYRITQQNISKQRKANRELPEKKKTREKLEEDVRRAVRSIFNQRHGLTIVFGRPEWVKDKVVYARGQHRKRHGTLRLPRLWVNKVYKNNIHLVGDYFTLTAEQINANVPGITIYRALVADLHEEGTIDGYISVVTFRGRTFNHFATTPEKAIRKANLRFKNETKKIMLPQGKD